MAQNPEFRINAANRKKICEAGSDDITVLGTDDHTEDTRMKTNVLLDYVEFLVDCDVGVDEVVSELVERHLPNTKIIVDRPQYSEIADQVSQIEDADLAWRRLIEGLPSCHASWYWDLLEILAAQPDSLAVVWDVEHDFNAKLLAHRRRLGAEEDVAATTTNVSAGSLPVDNPSDGAGCSNNVAVVALTHLDDQRIAAISTLAEYIGSNAEVLPPRRYQLELVQPILEGHNVVLTAPTGSGKTLVAAHAMRKHFEQMDSRLGQQKRVIFLVPTVPLVDQQSAFLHSQLCDICLVDGVCGGETTIPKLPLILNNHVIVMTPQILINMMMYTFGEALRWDDFTMLVIDECHHADKRHPYNLVMENYAEVAEAGEVRMPQVLGMTASMGTGQAENIDAAKHHILRLCARLCATRLSMVYRERDNLKQFVDDPFDAFVHCAADYAQHPYYTLLRNFMKSIERRIKPTLDALVQNGELVSASKRRSLNQIPSEPYSLRYEQWRNSMTREHLPKLAHSDIKLDLLRCFDHLRIYGHALEILAHLPARFAHRYVEEQMNALERSERTAVNEMDHRLLQQYKQLVAGLSLENDGHTNDLVEKLSDELKREFARDDAAERRAIVFVRTRAMTRFLRDHLNGNQTENKDPVVPGVRVGILTSVNPSEEKFGQSKDEQDRQLRSFRKGTVQVLIATSVAEEGLDIAQCSLIITYNLVSSDVARQQKKGRARRMRSRSVLLAQDGWIADREIRNMRKLRLLEAVLDNLHSLGVVTIEKMIEKVVAQLRQDRIIEKQQRTQKRQELAANVFRLQCRQCSTLIAHSNALRLAAGSHHVVVDDKIWMRSRLLPLPRGPKVYDGCAIGARLTCDKCRHFWGTVILLGGLFLPTLHPDGFTVFDDRDTHKPLPAKSQWSRITDAYFNVNAKITDDEKQRMETGLQLAIDKDPEFVRKMKKEIEEEELRLRDSLQSGLTEIDKENDETDRLIRELMTEEA